MIPRTLLLIVACLAGALPGIGFTEETPPGARPKVYDESANGERQISDALAVATNANKNVLLLFGSNGCVPCLKLHAFLDSDKAVKQALKKNYVLASITFGTPQNQNLPLRYAAENGFGLPFIVVLGANGMYLTTKNTDDLAEGDHYSREKTLAFLMDWKPKLRPALARQLADIVMGKIDLIGPETPDFKTLRTMSSDVVPYLLEVIGTNAGSTNDQGKRAAAYQTIGCMHSVAQSAIPFLIEQFNTNNFLLEFDASTLREFGPDAKQAIPVLTNVFQTGAFRARYEAASALAKVDPEWPDLIPQMLIWLKSSDIKRRRTAPIILGDLGPLAAIASPELLAASNDQDKWVRQHAAQALKKIGPDTTEKPATH